MAPQIVSTPASGMAHQPDTATAAQEQGDLRDNTANDADYTDSRLVAEPSGAVSAAALFNRRHELPTAQKIAAIISGGNVDPRLLAEILSLHHNENSSATR